jgi:hypothetical protein
MTGILKSRCACCVLALAVLMPLGAAEAGSKSTKRIGTTVIGQDLPSSQMAPLTAGECKRLGGRVDNETNCKSGTECTTQTLDGAWHSACITEVE